MVAAVVILYHPDLSLLRRLIESVAEQVNFIIAVDNTPGKSTELPSFFRSIPHPVSYLPLGENMGIAEAQNIGIRRSMSEGCSHVLLLDQDSAPCTDMVKRLLDVEGALLSRGERIAAMSPQVIDGRTGSRPCACTYRWLRAWLVFRDVNSSEPVQTENFIASGSLIRNSVLQLLGMMRSDLFIEHVDTEFASRVLDAGYRSYCVPNALMLHSFGDASAKLFGKDIYLYSGVRYYYKLRNEVYLARLKTMSRQWRAYILPRIPYHFVLYSLLSKDRVATSRLLLRAMWDGIRGRLGPLELSSTSEHDEIHAGTGRLLGK